VRLGIVSDSHLCPAGTPPGFWHNVLDYDQAEARLADAIRFLRDRDVEAVAMLGDLTNFGDEASIARAVGVLSSAEVPVLVVPGNHDCEFGAAEFRAHVDRLGAPGVAMAVDQRQIGDLRLVGLTELRPDDDGKLVIADVASAGWGDGPIVVLSHFPLLDRRAETEAAGLKYAGGFRDAGVIRRLRDRLGPAIVLHGHLHIRDTTAEANVLQIGCASLIEPPYETTIVEIGRRDGGWQVEVEHASRAASDARLPVMAAAGGTWDFDGTAWTPA
jgi:3',5'-cyclic AMP phosphodiesterase CpdA